MNEVAGVEERTARLREAVERLLQRAEGLSEERLYRAPAAGEWTVMEGLAHVAEVLPYWSRQARDVATRAQNNQPFGRTHDDPDRIGAVAQHARDRLGDVLSRLREGLAVASATMRELPAEGWSKTANHRNRGEMSVAQIIDQFLIDHVEEHAQQVEGTLAAID